MVQARSSAPDVAETALQSNHCFHLGAETLTDLKGSGFTPPQYLMQIPETIQGNIPLSPCAM